MIHEEPGEWRRPTEPLGGTVRILAVFMLMVVVLGLVLPLMRGGSSALGGVGDAAVCVTQPNETYGSSAWTASNGFPYTPKAGAMININAALQACNQHPSLSQRTLATARTLPNTLMWLGVLFLLWRLVRTAERYGPFTLATARLLRFLGWFIIGGTIIAGFVEDAATDALLSSMLRNFNGSFADFLPVNSGMIIAMLAGVVALTFARIVRVGARMDEDLQGTV
jgi:hypothetical protein